MKKNLKVAKGLALALLLGQSALAQQVPITQTNQGGVTQVGAGQGGQNGNGGLTQTDQSGVRNVGNNQGAFAQRVSLASGMYYMADMRDRKEIYGLLVEQDVNNAGNIIAIMVPLETLNGNGRSGRGYFLQGRSIMNGAQIMFSPISLNAVNGNLTVVSETREDAPVLMLTAQPGRANKYPYLLTGLNGMLGGSIYGIRGAESGRPSLNALPTQGFFLAADRSQQQVLVQGLVVTLNQSGSANGRFQLSELNGDASCQVGGKFSALLATRFNTMGEFEVVPEAIKKIATFFRQPGKDMMIIGSPAWGEGEFQFNVYKQAEKSIQDRWFPGRRDPRGSGN